MITAVVLEGRSRSVVATEYGVSRRWETLDEKATERLWSLLALGDPAAEVAVAYRVKERLRTSTTASASTSATSRTTRIRALLYAGRPNWRVLGSIVVR